MSNMATIKRRLKRLSIEVESYDRATGTVWCADENREYGAAHIDSIAAALDIAETHQLPAGHFDDGDPRTALADLRWAAFIRAVRFEDR